MLAELTEQVPQEQGDGLARAAASLMLGSEAEPDLDGPRLVRLWSKGTVTDQRTIGPGDRDLQLVSGHIGLGRSHRGHELPRLLDRVRGIPPLVRRHRWVRPVPRKGFDVRLPETAKAQPGRA